MKLKGIIWIGMAFAAVALVAAALSFAGVLHRRPPPVEQEARTSHTFLALDTVIEITVYGGEEKENRILLKEAERLCLRYEELFSRTLEGSDISRFNASREGVEVDPETAEVVGIGLDYSRFSHGVFDISIGPVSSLWDFNSAGGIPDADRIAEGLAHVDYNAVWVEGNRILKSDPDVQLDLGGVAKGYIADKLGEYFASRGADRTLINLGGNVLALGEKTDGPWVVGVETPFSADGELLCTIRAADLSIVTSGVSQRYFREEGRLYHHLLDTGTGYPAESGLHAVSVVCKTSLEAECLSTLCFLLGVEEGMDLLENLPGVEGIFVTEEGTVRVTSGLEAAYQVDWK